MKKILLSLLALALLPALNAQSAYLKFTPETPKAGEPVRFEYDIALSPLAGAAEELEVLALEPTDDSPRALEPMTRQSGGKLVGTFLPGKEASVVLLAFKAGERWDNNAGEGYFLPLRDAAGKAQPAGLAAQAVLYRDWGWVCELNRKATTALDWLNQAFALQPALRTKYFSNYAGCLTSSKRGDAGKTEAIAFLQEVEKTPGLTEKDWTSLLRWYERLSASERTVAVREQIKKNYPKGTLVRQERRQAMRNEPDLARYETLIEAYLRDFPPTSTAEHDEVSELYLTLGNKAAEKKDWALLEKTAKPMKPAARANLYNNTAWQLAENSAEDLAPAANMAEKATDWAKEEITRPTEPKPSYQSEKDWAQSRRNAYAQNADTYAFVLDKLKNHDAAAALQAEVVEITKGENTDMNERYAEYLEHAKAPDLRYRLEGFIMHGKASAKMKDQFKRLYIAEDKSTAGTEAYLAGLEKAAKANRRKELTAQMLLQPAPAFRLKNLAGEEVSLESLRGKVVVVDFWATWCGPCKASFPGMQQTLTNFKEDPRVAFVFVDTWERVADKAKAVTDFIQSKGYTFNVLMDTEDQVVASYGVSGIPTKFVLDPQGNIRFKAIGYGGSTDGLVDELTAMIELALEMP